MVGSANTVPRHPTALYYNTTTRAQAIDEYNYFYAVAPAGTCTANCLATPLTVDADFDNYIVPRDTAFDMGFIMSNDPRPFYAHVTNLIGGTNALAYPLLNSILGTYRAAFTTVDAVVTRIKSATETGAQQIDAFNLRLTQAADQLLKQKQWTTDKATVSGYVQNGAISITNTTGHPAPFTAPVGSTIANTTLQPYGAKSPLG